MNLYLRRFTKKGHCHKGVVFASLFLCRESERGLSYHKKPTDWLEDDLKTYQRRNVLTSGDLPGVIEIAEMCFRSASLATPSPVDGGESDPFREIHCESECLG